VSRTSVPRLGSVAWAELEDANGFGKVRPVVVVTPTAEIAPGKPVRVVAITTRLPATLPDDHVLLPWDAQGKARSGLRRQSAAVATWQAEIPVARVQQVVGILPPKIIGELLAKISASLPAPPATPAPGLVDAPAEILEGPRATSPSGAGNDRGERTGEIA
jgi:mRNA-degrading endonuclease toxin of MazEF toxin-antitoxin module